MVYLMTGGTHIYPKTPTNAVWKRAEAPCGRFSGGDTQVSPNGCMKRCSASLTPRESPSRSPRSTPHARHNGCRQ